MNNNQYTIRKQKTIQPFILRIICIDIEESGLNSHFKTYQSAFTAFFSEGTYTHNLKSVSGNRELPELFIDSLNTLHLTYNE